MEGIKMRFFPILVLLFCSPTAFADYYYYHFNLSCNSSYAEIVPFSVDGKNVESSTPEDCSLSSGRTVRVKMVVGNYDYKQVEEYEDVPFSVWVDKAKVFDHRTVTCSNTTGKCNVRLKITDKGIEECKVKIDDDEKKSKNLENLKLGIEANTCKFIPNEQLANKRDPLEFPAENEKIRPPVGSLAVIYAADEKFCKSFKSGESTSEGNVFNIANPMIKFPEGVQLILPAIAPTDFSHDYSVYSFDVNNEGQPRTVLHYQMQYTHVVSDYFLIYKNGEKPIHSNDWINTASRVFPIFWSDKSGETEHQFVQDISDHVAHDYGSYQFKHVVSPWWDKENSLEEFDLGWTNMWPFRYENVTYFLMISRLDGFYQWRVILRPEKNYEATEMCIFQIVQPNF
jgi:hypothetical protein